MSLALERPVFGTAAFGRPRRLALGPPRAGTLRSTWRAVRRIRASAEKEQALGTGGTAAAVAGALANPIMLWSEFVFRNTGEGVPPGPFGIFGAAEGISYLVVLGIVGWSAVTKVRTGQGLPSGPGGLLGAVEGFSYLSTLGAAIVFGLEVAEKGSLPGFLGR